MSLLEEFASESTIKEKTVEIRGKKVLFREPPMGEHNVSRKKYMRLKMVQKEDGEAKKHQKKGDKKNIVREMEYDSENSDIASYNRELVMMTAYDPSTGERLFPSKQDFDRVFGVVDGVLRNGESLFSEFLKGAESVMGTDGIDEAEKN